MSRVPTQNGCKKANFSGFTKFQNFFRKIRSYSTTLESLHTVKKLFAIAFTVYLSNQLEWETTPPARRG
jgi:hypothetical protein